LLASVFVATILSADGGRIKKSFPASVRHTEALSCHNPKRERSGAAVKAAETHPYFGTQFCVPDSHPFWRNPASGRESRQNAPKSAAEFEPFSAPTQYAELPYVFR